MDDTLTTEMLVRFQRGDAVVFRQLIERYSPRLLVLARSFASDDDEAHDLLQDTWFRVYRKRKDFSGRGTFLAWSMSVCKNICLDAIAKKSSRERLASANIDASLPAFVPDADVEAHRRELRNSLRKSVAELPDRERDIVVMRLLEGRSVRETAHQLGIAEGTVKATLHHAIKKLRISMEVWVQ